MMCTECDFDTDYWNHMREHYKYEHPEVKNVTRLFTKDARDKMFPPINRHNLVTWNGLIYGWLINGMQKDMSRTPYGELMTKAELLANYLTDAVAKQRFNMGTKYRKFD